MHALFCLYISLLQGKETLHAVQTKNIIIYRVMVFTPKLCIKTNILYGLYTSLPGENMPVMLFKNYFLFLQ